MSMTRNYKSAILAAFLMGIMISQVWLWFHKFFTKLDPPSAQYARALINDCDAFTVADHSSRRAISIESIDKNLDSGGNAWVRFKWKWVSGDETRDLKSHESASSFVYSLEDRQWHIDRVRFADENQIDDVCSKTK